MLTSCSSCLTRCSAKRTNEFGSSQSDTEMPRRRGRVRDFEEDARISSEQAGLSVNDEVGSFEQEPFFVHANGTMAKAPRSTGSAAGSPSQTANVRSMAIQLLKYLLDFSFSKKK